MTVIKTIHISNHIKKVYKKKNDNILILKKKKKKIVWKFEHTKVNDYPYLIELQRFSESANLHFKEKYIKNQTQKHFVLF